MKKGFDVKNSPRSIRRTVATVPASAYVIGASKFAIFFAMPFETKETARGQRLYLH